METFISLHVLYTRYTVVLESLFVYCVKCWRTQTHVDYYLNLRKLSSNVSLDPKNIYHKYETIFLKPLVETESTVYTLYSYFGNLVFRLFCTTEYCMHSLDPAFRLFGLPYIF